MATILLREDDITKNTPVGGSVEMSRLIPAIKQAQITAIKPLLGDTLYNKLTEDFKEDNLSGIYLELYDDYVKPMLVHLSTSYFFTYGAYQIGNKGIYKATGSDTEGLSKNEVDYISKAQYSYYEAYKGEFFNFIDVNAKYITEYSKSETASTKRKTFGGWSFGVNGNASNTGGNASSAIKNEIEVLEESLSILEGTVGDNGNAITLIQDNIEVLDISWGDIQGSLLDQTDLVSVLNDKVDKANGERLINSSEITKLDNIEANADITDTENVRSSGALMDDEVANLQEIKDFDSSDYANAVETTNALNDRVKSVTVSEPNGSDVVANIVSLTQAEYDAGTPVADTFYIITD
jgi:hypothetical protein